MYPPTANIVLIGHLPWYAGKPNPRNCDLHSLSDHGDRQRRAIAGFPSHCYSLGWLALAKDQHSNKDTFHTSNRKGLQSLTMMILNDDGSL